MELASRAWRASPVRRATIRLHEPSARARQASPVGSSHPATAPTATASASAAGSQTLLRLAEREAVAAGSASAMLTAKRFAGRIMADRSSAAGPRLRPTGPGRYTFQDVKRPLTGGLRSGKSAAPGIRVPPAPGSGGERLPRLVGAHG